MPVQNKPIIHARDHLEDGADPIRGLLTGPGAAGDYPLQILDLNPRGYWRLGEGSDPYLDTSGYDPPDAADLGINVGTGGDTPVTEDITPGLLPEDQDDGAVGFNEEGSDSGLSTPPHLVDPATALNFNFDYSNPAMTAVALIRPATTAVSFWGSVVSVWNDSLETGWGLQVRFPTGEIDFFRSPTGVVGDVESATSPALATDDETHLVAATYDGSLIRVYHNGTLAASQADTADLDTIGIGSAYRVRIGAYNWSFSGTFWRPFYGVIDEVAIFGQALTAAQIAGLYDEASADVVAAGYVPTTDGAGGVTWQPPTLTVNY